MPRILLIPNVAALENVSQIHPNDVLVPLHLEVEHLIHQGNQVLRLADLVSHVKIKALALHAQGLAKAIARGIAGTPFDEIDWGAILNDDAQLMYVRELLLGEALAQALLDHSPTEVVWLGTATSVRESAPHGLLAALGAVLGSRLKIAGSTPSFRSQWHSRVWSRWRRERTRWSRLAELRQPNGVRYVSIFALSEWERFTQPLQELRVSLRDAYEFWYLGPPPPLLQDWTRDHNITLRTFLYPRRIEPEVRQEFQSRWQMWQSVERYRVAHALNSLLVEHDVLVPHFEQMCLYTLPHIVQWARKLAKHLEAAKPDLLIGSSASTHTSFLPFHVAKKIGIPTLALPVAQVPGGIEEVPADLLACKTLFQRKNYQAMFQKNDGVLYCSDAVNRLAYTPTRVPTLSLEHKRIVAILSAFPTIQPENLMPFVDTTRFLAIWRGLLQPPGDLDGLAFYIKSHPRFDLSGLHRPEWSRAKSNVCFYPASAPVTDLLERAWVIVVWDHYGSVVSDAILADKPLLFLEASDFFFPFIDDHGKQAGTLVHALNEFWEILRTLQADDAIWTALAERTRSFHHAELTIPTTSLAQQLARRFQSSHDGSRPSSYHSL